MITILVSTTACRSDQRSALPSTPILLVDDAGDTVRLTGPVHRIVSLVPSATESIVALHPDLVIGWGNDARQTARTRLASLNVPVFTMRARDTRDAFRAIHNLGQVLARDSAATSLARSIRATLDSVRSDVAGRPPRDVMFVIYPDPPMTVGSKTFIDELIGVAGGRSVFRDSPDPWPTVSIEEIVKRGPELLMVSQTDNASAIEQFRARVGWRDLDAVRAGRVATVSADFTQRPGARLGEAARALELAIHPGTRGR